MYMAKVIRTDIGEEEAMAGILANYPTAEFSQQIIIVAVVARVDGIPVALIGE
jgi:hypothetical protein